jgi:hypothetical protein
VIANSTTIASMSNLSDEQVAKFGAHALSLSALIWEGDPLLYHVSDGQEDEELGMYVSPGPAGRLQLQGWSEEQGALSYIPADSRRHEVVYSRTDYVGQTSSETTYYGAVLNLPDERCPLFFLHKQSASPFANLRFSTPDDDGFTPPPARPRTGPPFKFLVSDTLEGNEVVSFFWALDCLQITEPDVPGQDEGYHDDPDTESDPSDSDVEQDGQRWTGWGGKWARELLKLSEKGLPMASLSRTIWNSGDEKWGIEFILNVRFDPHLYYNLRLTFHISFSQFQGVSLEQTLIMRKQCGSGSQPLNHTRSKLQSSAFL